MKKHSIRKAISLLLCFVMLSSVVLTSCGIGGDTSVKPTESNEDTESEETTQTEINVTDVSLDNTTLTLNVGETSTLTATVSPENATDKSVTWTSSDTAIVTVSDGTVTAVGAGTATITVETANGKTATCTVTVGVGLTYELSSDGSGYVVTGYSGSAECIIPDTYNGLPVIGIAGNAFKQNNNLKKITIPDSVTSLGFQAFDGCTVLTSVTIGNGVTSIGDEAFYYCSGLTSITIPDSVTSIGDHAFENCSSLTSITIGNGVTSIGDYAFSGCGKLIEVINKSALDIRAGSNDYGYVACYAKEVHNGTTKIDNQNGYLFYTFDGVNYLLGYVGNNTELVLPDYYKGEAYEIYNYAFRGCSGLTSITIPDSVTSIGDGAFSGCSGLTSIIVESGNTVYQSKGNCLIKTESKALIAGCKNSVIPTDGSVTSIGYRAFFGCSGLTSITIPNSVTSIGFSAFFGCTGLTSITIPDSVTSIYSSAFYGCSGLTSITIPNSVTSLGDYAFSGCSSLTSITIPDSVTSIGSYAFRDCTGLTSINYNGTKAQWNAISKEYYWNANTGAYTIYCTDGTISK